MTSRGNNFIDFPKPGLHPPVHQSHIINLSQGGLHPQGGLHKSDGKSRNLSRIFQAWCVILID